MGLAAKTAPSFYGKMKNKQIYRIISVVSLLVMALAILSIVYMLFLYQKSNREYQALAEEARAAAERMAEQKAEEAQQKINNLNQRDSLERFAREQYFMHQPGEDVYLVEE